jgi:hypothetical protein
MLNISVVIVLEMLAVAARLLVVVESIVETRSTVVLVRLYVFSKLKRRRSTVVHGPLWSE